jgi:TonB-dependent receptor
MVKLNYGDLITFVPGLRYEYSNNDYTGIYSTISNFPAITGFYKLQESNQSYGEFLPSAHLKIKPVPWMDVRLSTVKTLSRPNYMWVLPRLRYVASSYQVSKSNPELKHATAWNYDASITVYTGKFGLLSFGGYLKEINNMFYQVSGTLTAQQSSNFGLPAQSFGLSQDFINLDDSYVKGLEFEYNTHFNFLPTPFDRFLLGFNMTRLWSGTYYLLWVPVNGLEMARDRPVLGIDFERSHYDKLEERMPSQVDLTLNAWLGFEYKGFSTRASLGYQGTRLTGVNTQQRSDAFNTYAASTLRIDFTAKQRINRMFSVLLNLNNLTNETDRGYRYQSKYPTYQNMYGFIGELGVQFNF